MRSKLVGLGVVLALVAGCDRTKAQEAPEAGDTVATAPAASSVDVTAPPPVVSGEPDIPLNEAVVGTAPVPSDFAADTAPPAPATEEQPTSPEASDVWCPGYWWWSMASHRYVWVSGAWRNPPPEQVWTPGMWVSSGERWVWVPGFWGARGAPAVAAVNMAPPPPPFETRPPPPEVGYIWGPGYYAWRGERYVWVEGGWMRPRGGFGWVEPRWVNYGGRHYFQPGRWDHDVSRRGTVYLPDPNARPGVRFTPVAVSASVVAQHEGYNSAAARAIARGATRQSNGTVSWHSGVEHGGGGAPGAQGGEHGGPGGQGGGHGGPGGQGGEHGGQGGEHGGQGGEHGGQGGEHGGQGGPGTGSPLREPGSGWEPRTGGSASAAGHQPPQQLHGPNPLEHPSIPPEGAGSARKRPH